MAEFPISATLRLLTGARVEHSDARVDAISTLGERTLANRVFTDVLPALALTFRPSNYTNLRVSASRTLARPEYRELAGIKSRIVSGGVDFVGNPNLVRTLIDNADLRWELYPRSGELLSAALFVKRFSNPIERVALASTAGSSTTVVNAQGADNVGVELEARKRLGVVADWLEPMSLFTSLTLMRSEVRLDEVRGALTNARRAMVGQAPYVINTGLTYASRDGKASATLLYNRVGTRVAEAGELPLPDVEEMARDMLDLSIRFPARRGLVTRVDAKNLMGARYHLTQGTVTRESYRIGRSVQVGFSVQR